MLASPAPRLETPRLRPRPCRLDDFPAYAALWAEPEVVRFIGGTPLTREAAWSRFLRHPGLWRFPRCGFLAVEEREAGRRARVASCSLCRA